MQPKLMSWLKKIDQILEKITIALLTLFLFSMLFFSVLNSVLRWFNTTYLWIEPLLSHLVFYSAFFGGVVATGEKQHICIDLFHRFLENKGWHKAYHRALALMSFLSAAVILWVASGSFRFINDTFHFDGEAFLGIHRGYLVSMIPLGLFFLAYRFLYLTLSSLMEQNP